ncbi:MAG TPA: hypothetical protein PLL99_01040 [Chitinophagales bacterium]|jgi:hypothetical protein|nr:hypothetical protein [Chitinophagales bacterium]
MNTRLVLWGEIGTDRKALVALYLDEVAAKIHIYALPKEEVTKEIQDALFVEWKNGGEFSFPEDALHWEIDANSDSILPEEVKVDRVDIVLQSQHKWGKKLMSSKINQLLTDEVKLLEEKTAVLAEYEQAAWDRAKTQWEKIASYQKKNEISWEQTMVLKDKINTIFEALKAIKRINNENEDQANVALIKKYEKQIEELQSKLIYNDQWKYIFDELKKIQAELKDASLRWNHKRNIYNHINVVFDDLRKYRMTEVVSKTQDRILQLNKILKGLKDSIARDNESYQQQVEKMQHYTRGKLSVEELQQRFGNILERTKEKETKADGIQQTIVQLKAQIDKEKRQHEEREQQRLKKEQEELEKKHALEATKENEENTIPPVNTVSQMELEEKETKENVESIPAESEEIPQSVSAHSAE